MRDHNATRGGSLMSPSRPLRRSRQNRVIAGVCGGLAESLGWSATRVRVAYVVLSLLSAAFPGTLVYIVLWIALPESES